MTPDDLRGLLCRATLPPYMFHRDTGDIRAYSVIDGIHTEEHINAAAMLAMVNLMNRAELFLMLWEQAIEHETMSGSILECEGDLGSALRKLEES